MKAITATIFACLLSGNALAAGPIYLECKVSSLTTDLSVTLNESTGKATQTYKANGSGFTSDAQFNANEIIYQKKIANLGQSERFTINRSTLAIEHAIFIDGERIGGGDGMCKVVKTKNNKI
jgi:hypothetical protein